MKKIISALLGMVLLGTVIPYRALGAVAQSEPQALVEKAQITLREFSKDPQMDWFRNALKDAKGVLVVPGLIKGGLIFGGSGGKGVFFIKEKNGLCKGPAFYNMGSLTFGLQIGGEKAQLVILAMSDSAIKAMLSPQFKMGGDASVAAGPVGVGSAGQVTPTAAFVAFSKNKGLFGGLTVEGAVVTINKDYNMVYYGKNLDTTDILILGKTGTSGGLCAMVERPHMVK
jgi:SH3 domain-containing YSC84-like protein 1